MYSYLLDILFLIVLSFSFGGKFLYGNSVSPCLLLSFSYCTFIYSFFFVRISRMQVATLHTSLHTRHRCENEAHIREIGRAQQAWERSCLRGKVVGMRRKLVSNFFCPLYLMRYYNCTTLFICVSLLRKIMQTNINKPE